MSFFQRGSGPEAFFRLLSDELEHQQQPGCTSRRQCQQQQQQQQLPQRPRTPTFTPRFDVKETGDAYELEGEFPGFAQRDIEIEFTDVQTLKISGRYDHRSTSTNAPTPPAEQKQVESAPASSAPAVEKAESVSSHQPTVEDEFEHVATPGSEADTSNTTTVAAVQSEKAPATATATSSTDITAGVQQPQAKYWVTERSTGAFARAFQFPDRVDQDAVRASLEHGILKIVVPKERKSSRKIVIN